MRNNRVRSSLAVILVLLVVISFNTFISALTERFGWKGDLTEGQLFRLSGTTKEILKELTEPVTITCFDRESGADTNINELLERYDRYSSMVYVRHVDLEAKRHSGGSRRQRGVGSLERNVRVQYLQ